MCFTNGMQLGIFTGPSNFLDIMKASPDKMKSRATRIDLNGDTAAIIFKDHVTADALKEPVENMWPYSHPVMKSASPKWPEIQKLKHLICDLLCATLGKRLRLKAWELQVEGYLRENSPGLNAEQIRLIAYRPRCIISQLHNFKQAA